jgi:signal transduction histidine kinase
MTRQMTEGSKVRAEVSVTGAARRIDSWQEHHLLRIGLEALTNALKHSGASRVDIELGFLNDATRLVVRDDGRGFPPAGADMPGGHFGLQGIRERVDKLGGLLTLENPPGGGLELAVLVPNRSGAPDEASALEV